MLSPSSNSPRSSASALPSWLPNPSSPSGLQRRGPTTSSTEPSLRPAWPEDPVPQSSGRTRRRVRPSPFFHARPRHCPFQVQEGPSRARWACTSAATNTTNTSSLSQLPKSLTLPYAPRHRNYAVASVTSRPAPYDPSTGSDKANVLGRGASALELVVDGSVLQNY